MTCCAARNDRLGFDWSLVGDSLDAPLVASFEEDTDFVAVSDGQHTFEDRHHSPYLSE